MHALMSRSIRHDPPLLHSPALGSIQCKFESVAAARCASSSTASSPKRLSALSSEASAGTLAGECKDELRRLLGSALTSVGALGGIYEAREVRWRKEVRCQNEDRERIELLLCQALLGFGLVGNGTMGGVRRACRQLVCIYFTCLATIPQNIELQHAPIWLEWRSDRLHMGKKSVLEVCCVAGYSEVLHPIMT
jgi:hypothetical protein